MSDSVMILGGGGHARVIIDCLEALGKSVHGILDDNIPAGTFVQGVPVVGTISDYEKYTDCVFVIGIGCNETRRRIAGTMNVRWLTLIHPTAIVSRYATVDEGTVIMPGAIVNAGAVVGSHCIINSGAVVEHDNRLGDFVHISPKVALGGSVTVGDRTHIGIGAVVCNNIDIVGDCVIAAGAAVVKSITEPGTYLGIPARKM